MNLREALEELTKRPKSVIGPGGESIPALHYTEHTHAALSWLCARYNDGTLQVIGYDPMEETRQKRLATFDKKRKGYVARDGELPLTELIKQSGIQAKTAKRVAIEAGALYKVGYYLYVDVAKFFDYWDKLKKDDPTDRYVNLTGAANMLGIYPSEAKELVKKGELYRDIYNPKKRGYRISVNSINAYLKKKGEQNGEDNSNNSEVH